MRVAAALTTVLALNVVTLPGACAWGRAGHRIIAEIAEQYLEPEPARHMREILALQNATTLADVANWADDIRRQRPETALWHFVNIPVHPPAGETDEYSPVRDCPLDNCIVVRSTILFPICSATRK
jgi:nuclease S1